MIIRLIVIILAATIGVFELALFTIMCFGCWEHVKKFSGAFIIGAVVCATLTVGLAIVGIFHIINF